jgi:hypothetical protein
MQIASGNMGRKGSNFVIMELVLHIAIEAMLKGEQLPQ